MPSKIPVWRPHPREVRSAGERGYDSRWQRVRASVLRAWLATRGPYCGLCGCLLRPGKETHVDHIVPFDGLDDPRRLDPQNLQILCRTCNSTKARHG
jgi:5-methylcytosine-specific restriction endonuclease McrA